MNPAVVFRKTSPDAAWLIDLDSIVATKAGDQRHGIACGAVFLADLRAGDLMINSGGRWEMPRCGRLVDQGQDWQIPALRHGQKLPEPYRPAHRGIFPDAAKVMLELASLAAPITIDGKKGYFPTKQKAGWDKWKFFAAWRWSAWQRFHIESGRAEWSLEDRWKDMRDHGYEKNFSAFKMMISRLGLSETTSRQG